MLCRQSRLERRRRRGQTPGDCPEPIQTRSLLRGAALPEDQALTWIHDGVLVMAVQVLTGVPPVRVKAALHPRSEAEPLRAGPVRGSCLWGQPLLRGILSQLWPLLAPPPMMVVVRFRHRGLREAQEL